MANLTITRGIAWAAATDAGNRSMRTAGRNGWNRSDYNTAARTFNTLWPEPRDTKQHLTEQQKRTESRINEAFGK